MHYKDPEKQRQYFREWYLRNRERKNAQSRAWTEAHPERVQEIKRKSYFKRKNR